MTAVTFALQLGVQDAGRAADSGGAKDVVPRAVTEKLDDWMQAALSWVATVLEANPPGTGAEDLRRLALTALDDPLHVESARLRRPVQAFVNRQLDRAVHEIATTSVAQGAVIWKLDNDGFIVKTRHHTYGFDVSDLAGPGTASAERRAVQLAEALDGSFTTHRHGDHLNPPFMQQMVALGKPVVIPPDLWSDDVRGKGMLRVAGGDKRSVAGMSCEVFPGHQIDVPNNVYLITSDGISIMHAGDQFQEADFPAWIDGLGKSRQVDVLLISCWTLDLPRVVQGARPKLVITGHENELWHPVRERESYADSFERLSAVHCPSLVMTWGEKLTWSEEGQQGSCQDDQRCLIPQ